MANFITVTGKFLLAKEMDWGVYHGIPLCVLSCGVHATTTRAAASHEDGQEELQSLAEV